MTAECSSVIAERSSMIAECSASFAEYSAVMAEYSAKLDEHCAMSAERSARLAECAWLPLEHPGGFWAASAKAGFSFIFPATTHAKIKGLRLRYLAY